VSIVSGETHSLDLLRDRLLRILEENGLSRVEWKEVTGDRRRTIAAITYISAAAAFAIEGAIRMDILTWDMHDDRHRIRGRDDIANLERMYYRLFTNMAKRHGQTRWSFYPDENSALDWEEIAQYISTTRLHKPIPGVIRLLGQDKSTIDLSHVEPQSSSDEPLVQLADLFVGLARFSRTCPDMFLKWKHWKSQRGDFKQLRLISPERTNLSKSERARLEVLDALDCACKGAKLQVSFESRGYLWTPNPANPINFWPYEPQHEMDRAPVKS